MTSGPPRERRERDRHDSLPARVGDLESRAREEPDAPGSRAPNLASHDQPGPRGAERLGGGSGTFRAETEGRRGKLTGYNQRQGPVQGKVINSPLGTLDVSDSIEGCHGIK